MINTFVLAGEVKKLTVTEPKDTRKNASAVLLVQYGVEREQTGGAVEFVNATLVRIPSYKFPQLKGKLRQGQTVQITGHIQGVFKTVHDNGFLAVELVADRIDVVAEPAAAPAAAAPAATE